MKKALLLLVLGFLAFGAAGVCAQEGQEKELHPALLVVDVQNIWLPYMSQEDQEAVFGRINELIALFRERGLPVIRVYHTDIVRGPEPGTEPFEFPAAINIKDDDPMVIKNYPSSFMKTDLEKILRDNGRDCVILCGLSATGCVLATHFGAMEREFETAMVAGAVLSPKVEHTKAIEESQYALSMERLIEILGNPEK
ncbi:MAG: cysteine hydrolase [Candidatus Krumholzibacteria bacterium]|nr:cysteine hydrolase [Candidatus Krumholzibacteria bacterium]